ncbi:DUF7737 domain-containing protein [Actinomadura luteofluorescens]
MLGRRAVPRRPRRAAHLPRPPRLRRRADGAGRPPLGVEPPRRTGQKGLFLPFEDEGLARVLGTAFLLAADHRITDEAVLRQIKRGA